jgi:hypothetical protein
MNTNSPFIRRRQLKQRPAQPSPQPPAITITPAVTVAVAERPGVTRRANLVLGIVMAVTSALVAGTSWLQWQTMEAQTKQNETIINQMRAEQEIMKQQSAQTDTRYRADAT